MGTSKVVVTQLGARRHYLEPILFHEWGMLERFYTDLYAGNNRVNRFLRQPDIYQRLPKALKKGIDRHDPALDGADVVDFPRLGIQYFQALRKVTAEDFSRVFLWSGKEFCRNVIKAGLGDADAVYGFNSAALELFEYAKPKGLRCILDQTLAEQTLLHQILLQEEATWKGWSIGPFAVNQYDRELADREHQEQELADRIICGSAFVKDSLIAKGIAADKIAIIPIGRRKGDPVGVPPLRIKPPRETKDELRILFAGAVGLRKGVPYLLEALKLLKGKIPFTCKIAGSIELRSDKLAEYADVCEVLGHVPRSLMTDLYEWADVFVLPSLCEGSAMVAYEAMSYGLPIITTESTGSIVRNGMDGWIVPIRDAAAISQRCIELFHGDLSHNPNQDLSAHINTVYAQSKTSLKDLIEN
jgi:glycosyltransferase involved in cell wall biosynthesis